MARCFAVAMSGLLLLTAFCRLTPADDDAPPTTQPTTPNYSAFKQSYHIPYGNTKPVDFDHLQSLSVRASINGGPPMRFQIDTGSTGVVVGATDVPNIDPNAPPGSITYSSSGIELVGVWTPVTITFPDSKDEQGNVATAVVPVLAVNERRIHPGAINGGKAQPMMNPKVFMFGIGNGRGKEPHPERNPWVNLKEMRAGTMRRGYTLTRDGITLGLTQEAVGKGWVYEKLKERTPTQPTTRPAGAIAKDWEHPRGWITVNGVKHPESAMLLDTGLTNMIAAIPDPPGNGDADAGTEITVHLQSGRLQYGFKVGDEKNPTTPRKVTWIKRPTTGFLVNTGLRVMANFDCLYDADEGFLALRTVEKGK